MKKMLRFHPQIENPYFVSNFKEINLPPHKLLCKQESAVITMTTFFFDNLINSRGSLQK